jgi:hypothetical protein
MNINRFDPTLNQDYEKVSIQNCIAEGLMISFIYESFKCIIRII